jgi:hypothetical protein
MPSAWAQKAATAVSDGAPQTAVEPRRHAHPPAGLGGSAVFGWAADGWVARLEYELFPVMAPHGRFGPLIGFSTGMEYWRDGDDKGFSVPVLIVGGVRFLPMRVLVGVGIQAFTLDVVNDDTGVGAWGPIAMASASIDLWGVRVGVDARATRHLELGAPDFNQLQLGISVGYTWSTVKRGTQPYY